MNVLPALYFTRDSVREEFFDEVKNSGIRVKEIYEDIFYAESGERLYWVFDFWPNVTTLDFVSISDAAKKLRALSRRWIYAGGVAFRRGQLIAEALKSRKPKAIEFAAAENNPPCAAFTLENEKRILYSVVPLKQSFAGGKMAFVEDRKGPPSRAYLKLWEVITLTGIKLSAADSVLDLGATPGGWSYVAASLGARVTMLDRARPDESLFRKFPGIAFVKGDGLQPAAELLAEATVILSDMACEPRKLLESIKGWVKLTKVRIMVCTLKFHGLSDKDVISRFAEIHGSEIYHLWHNGHELTWVWRRE